MRDFFFSKRNRTACRVVVDTHHVNRARRPPKNPAVCLYQIESSLVPCDLRALHSRMRMLLEENLCGANGTKHFLCGLGDDASQHRKIAHLSTAFHDIPAPTGVTCRVTAQYAVRTCRGESRAQVGDLAMLRCIIPPSRRGNAWFHSRRINSLRGAFAFANAAREGHMEPARTRFGTNTPRGFWRATRAVDVMRVDNDAHAVRFRLLKKKSRIDDLTKIVVDRARVPRAEHARDDDHVVEVLVMEQFRRE